MTGVEHRTGGCASKTCTFVLLGDGQDLFPLFLDFMCRMWTPHFTIVTKSMADSDLFHLSIDLLPWY